MTPGVQRRGWPKRPPSLPEQQYPAQPPAPCGRVQCLKKPVDAVLAVQPLPGGQHTRTLALAGPSTLQGQGTGWATGRDLHRGSHMPGEPWHRSTAHGTEVKHQTVEHLTAASLRPLTWDITSSLRRLPHALRAASCLRSAAGKTLGQGQAPESFVGEGGRCRHVPVLPSPSCCSTALLQPAQQLRACLGAPEQDPSPCPAEFQLPLLL